MSVHAVTFRIRGECVYSFRIGARHYWQAVRAALETVGCRLRDVTLCEERPL